MGGAFHEPDYESRTYHKSICGRSMTLIGNRRRRTTRMNLRVDRCLPSIADSPPAAKQKVLYNLHGITWSNDRLLAQESRGYVLRDAEEEGDRFPLTA